MSTLEFVEQIVQETVATLELKSVAAYEGCSAWELLFDDETRLNIEYDRVATRVVFMGTIGAVAEPARLRVYEFLLQYNYLWSETGGVRMALDGAPGHVAMIFELPTSDLGVHKLRDTVTSLVENLRWWREIIQTVEAAGDGTTPRDGLQERVAALSGIGVEP